MPSLDLLRTFVDAAEAPSLREAAAKRHVTKSAVSQRLKVLEAELGAPLFERVGRHVRPTAEAKALAVALRPAFAAVDDAVDAMREARGSVRGVVTVGAPRPFTRAVLRSKLAALAAAHPELVLSIRFGVPSELEAALVHGDLDLAVLSRDVETDALERSTIFVETFVAVAAAAYLRAHGTPKAPADLSTHRFLAFDRDLPMHAPWWRAIRAPSKHPARIACFVASLDELLGLAALGAGIAVLPDYFVADALATGAVVEVLPRAAPRPPKNPLVLAWRRGRRPARLEAVRRALLG